MGALRAHLGQQRQITATRGGGCVAVPAPRLFPLILVGGEDMGGGGPVVGTYPKSNS